MMKIILLIIVATILGFMGCTSSSISWQTLMQQESGYCASKFSNKEEREECEIQYLAIQHAKKECQNYTHPEYCLVIAQYSWDNYIKYVLKRKPTKADAQSYPMICAGKEEK
ncbi:MAG: hypothetical protein JXQ76_10005 [Campylobacterales bacterium]|nr:hypothetical protein [Campylobacterales bacterium]